MNNISTILMGFVLALICFGCCGNPIEKRKELANCDFGIKNITIENISATSLTLGIDLKIYNPNQIDVILDKMDVDIWVDSGLVGRVTHRDKATIASKKSRIIPISVNLKTLEAYQTIKKLLNKETLSYHLKGKVYFHTIFGDIGFPFETEEETVVGKK